MSKIDRIIELSRKVEELSRAEKELDRALDNYRFRGDVELVYYMGASGDGYIFVRHGYAEESGFYSNLSVALADYRDGKIAWSAK